MGSPTLNGAGVLAAGTYNITDMTLNAVYLLNAANGTILATIPEPNLIVFAQPVFAGSHVFVARHRLGRQVDGLHCVSSKAVEEVGKLLSSGARDWVSSRTSLILVPASVAKGIWLERPL